MRSITKLIATFFYAGYLPIAGGTISAFLALGLYYFIKDNTIIYACVVLFMVFLGFLVSSRAEKIFGKKDAAEITIDDASGMLIALFLIPQQLIYIILAFVIYRVFDILKVPPIRKVENLKGSSGIMLDDIIAGLYTNLIIHTIHYIVLAIR